MTCSSRHKTMSQYAKAAEPWLSLISRGAKFCQCPNWTNFIWILHLSVTRNWWRCQFLQQRSWFFSHFLEWDDDVRFQHVDSRFCAIRRKIFDGAFRSNDWTAYFSASIKDEIYIVFLQCNSLIIAVGCFMSCWFLLNVRNKYLCVFVVECIYHGWWFVLWDPFVALMEIYSLSPCVKLSCW